MMRPCPYWKVADGGLNVMRNRSPKPASALTEMRYVTFASLELPTNLLDEARFRTRQSVAQWHGLVCSDRPLSRIEKSGFHWKPPVLAGLLPGMSIL